MIKLAMITECWTPQSSYRDTFSLYISETLYIREYSLCRDGTERKWPPMRFIASDELKSLLKL